MHLIHGHVGLIDQLDVFLWWFLLLIGHVVLLLKVLGVLEVLGHQAKISGNEPDCQKSIASHQTKITSKYGGVYILVVEVDHKAKLLLALHAEQEWCIEGGNLQGYQSSSGKISILHLEAHFEFTFSHQLHLAANSLHARSRAWL